MYHFFHFAQSVKQSVPRYPVFMELSTHVD